MALINTGTGGATVLTIDDGGELGARVTLYDPAGNVIVVQGNQPAATTQRYLPVSGLDAGTLLRAVRVSEYGTRRDTSEVTLYQDAVEGATVNTGWTQSTGTATIAQTTGVLTLNNSAVTGAGNYAIVTSTRQFPKYPRQPLYLRFRASLSADVPTNHTVVEMGLGSPSGATPVTANATLYRLQTDGSLWAVLACGGTEQTLRLLAPSSLVATSYYYFDLIVDNDFVRFIVSDANQVPIVDQQLSMSLTNPYLWTVSHLPSYARVYVDAVGGGTAIKLNLSAHSVQLLDAQLTRPWAEIQGATQRSLIQGPTSYAQLPLLSSAAPVAFTPTNGANATNTTLGGEYIGTMTANSENLLSLFAFTIPTPYTLYLRGVYWAVPFVSTVFSIATNPPFIWPFIIANASSNNIGTATGSLAIAMGQMWTATITAAVGTRLTGTDIAWKPQSPIACQPGTVLHLGWKNLNAGAVTTGAVRGYVLVDGYFE
jgi:hypothetical protein